MFAFPTRLFHLPAEEIPDRFARVDACLCPGVFAADGFVEPDLAAVAAARVAVGDDLQTVGCL